jgi:formylglycine-generating enzyme required for sulfatase activity
LTVARPLPTLAPSVEAIRAGGRALRLGDGPPDEALARELRQVAAAAKGVVRTLGEINTLPRGFPEAALRDLCAALGGLPEGTAEGSRTQLELARNLLPKIRREHFVEDEEEAAADEAEPPLWRDGVLDQRMAALIAAVSTALDEYRFQAQDHFDDTVRAEETVAVDRLTTERLLAGADAVAEGAGRTIAELDAKGVAATERGEVLRRRVKDGENLSLAAKAQLENPPVVRRWLAGVASALQRTPDLIKAAADVMERGVDIAEPFADWWETTRRDAWASLFKSIRGLAQALREATERATAPRRGAAAARPTWAIDAGADEYGDWAEFEYEGVRQRLRWIPPGTFTMGSPANELGRTDAEGPQHEVTIGAGFHLFATPVTQALYEAVTGENPSGFKGAERPVENVSWHDAQTFLQRLNEGVPGLDLVMPSEAQWEYACRARTTTATYAGDLPGLEATGAGVLDGIAWFNTNSGGKSRPVSQKRPNAWGLYDMLGNAFEWCEDELHGEYEGAPSDGSEWMDVPPWDDAPRVIRGGSWNHVARYCRAAFRVGFVPYDRSGFLGFRSARGQG